MLLCCWCRKLACVSHGKQSDVVWDKDKVYTLYIYWSIALIKHNWESIIYLVLSQIKHPVPVNNPEGVMDGRLFKLLSMSMSSCGHALTAHMWRLRELTWGLISPSFSKKKCPHLVFLEGHACWALANLTSTNTNSVAAAFTHLSGTPSVVFSEFTKLRGNGGASLLVGSDWL